MLNRIDRGGGAALTALIAIVRASSRGRLVLTMFAVPAILIGLLAMHVLASGNMTDTQDHNYGGVLATSVGTDMAMAASSGTVDLSHGCGGVCMPSHDLLGMICILAVLAGAILFGLQLVLAGWPSLTRIFGALQVKAAALAPPTPPSLHVLSISRT
jgi:hypothetical protein